MPQIRWTVKDLAGALRMDAAKLQERVDADELGELTATEDGPIITARNVIKFLGPRKASELITEPTAFVLARYSNRGVTFQDWNVLLKAKDLCNAEKCGHQVESVPNSPEAFMVALDAFLTAVESGDLNADSDSIYDLAPEVYTRLVDMAKDSGGT